MALANAASQNTPEGTGTKNLSAEFSRLCDNLKATNPGLAGSIQEFALKAQEMYSRLSYANGNGSRVSAKEAGLSEEAFLYGLIAFENTKGRRAVAPKEIENAVGKANFSGSKFAVYDMDKARSKNRVFLIDVEKSEIADASRAMHSKSSGSGEFVEKVGQTGQTQAYGVFALWGVRNENFSAYLFGQEPVNRHVGSTIPKRFHEGNKSSFEKSVSEGCVVVPVENYAAYQRQTGNFKDPIMLYTHTTKAYDAKFGAANTAFFTYSKNSSMLSLEFLRQEVAQNWGKPVASP